MKKKKSLIIIIISILVVLGIGLGIYFFLKDDNKLTVSERNWVNENINAIQNINVLNNVNVFGKDGSGVFYDFIESFEKEYSLTVNPITFNNGDTPKGVTLGIKRNYIENDLVLYKDHYVLVGKDNEIVKDVSSIADANIGILADDEAFIKTYIKEDLKFVKYETKQALLKGMKNIVKETKEGSGTEVTEEKPNTSDKVNYMIVPLMDYLDEILSRNYHVIYHFSDIKLYFTLELKDNNLSKVLTKHYNKWIKDFDKIYNKELFKVFTTSLKISDTDIDSMQSISYDYGFVNNSPYEVIMGGKYGGIIAVLLSKFSDFADVEFNFEKYKNFDKFNTALENGDIDLYFNYYNIVDNYNETNGFLIKYVVVLPRKNNTVIKTINSLIGEEVYVEENSKIHEYLKQIKGININTFSTTKELFKLNKKDVIIVLDKNAFDYYSDNKLDNYTERYSNYISSEYTFKVKEKSTLYKLLNKFISILDEDEIILEGFENHYETVKSGGLITKIAEYLLGILLIVAIVVFIILKKSKKIKIAKKIKKEDKLKFIDQLTSLKNRNYLNENIEQWNNNTIYPQTIIVIDLNKVQAINDQHGYNEGDNQIKALANILIKTQLDNSEIMRTDGNEYVVYLVGYSQKQVTSYIHKLAKEIKKLPYDFGAEFGYSIIEDDIKTIEDALNEAVEDMKKNKDNKDDKETKA